MVVPGYPRSNLFSVLLYVCKLLHLNELEVLQWSVCAESGSVEWDRKDLSQSIILLLLGFQVKQLFNPKELVDVYHCKTSLVHTGFKQWLAIWNEDEKNRIDYSPIALNSQYNAFHDVSHNAKVDGV